MDIDLDLLGPYGDLFRAKGGVFKGSGRSGPATIATANRVHFEGVHKKRNVRFNQDFESRRQARQLTQQEIRKERRSTNLISKRDPKMATLTLAEDFDLLIHEDSSNEISAIEGSDDSDNSSTEPSTSQEALHNQMQSEVTGKIIAIPTPIKKGLTPIIKPNPNGVVTNGIKSRNNFNNNVANNNKSNNRAKVNPVNNAKTAEAAPLPSISDARRAKLERWKKEKEADLAVRRNQPKPFKAGVAAAAAVTSKSTVTVGTSNVSKNSALARPTTATSMNLLKQAAQTLSKQPVTQTSKTKPVTSRAQPTARVPQPLKPVVKPEETRRVVTRAMSKAQTGPSVGSTIGLGLNGRTAAATGVKPAIQKMKNLNISEKNKPSTTTGKPGVVTGSKPGIIGNARAGPSQILKPSTQPTKAQATASAADLKKANPPGQLKPSVAKSKPVQRLPLTKTPTPALAKTKIMPTSQKNSTTESNSDNLEAAPVPTPTPAVEQPKEVSKKKMKPKAIDSAYIDFNSRFSLACQKLKGYSGAWTEYLEDKDISDISEKNLGDIRSAMGKVKLLLDSKLPQFGELLFSYLCQQVDPNPVLVCDLQGWWDVAEIQLEAVDKIFEDLSKLRDNKWNDSPPPPIENTQSQEAKPLTEPRVLKPSVKAKATGGLKAFLANKRKMLGKPGNEENNVAESGSAVAIKNEDAGIDTEKIGETFILPNTEKTFDGGFYKISSPQPKPVDSLRKRELPATPNHDSSLNSSRQSFYSAVRTPTRRNSQRLSTASDASLRRLSMGILAVRQSYGSIMKIGVKPMSSEDVDNSFASLAENTMDELQAEDEMQIDD